MEPVDFLVIGSGVAGLTFALKTAENRPGSKILVVTKADESESNTKYAQGGIAVVLDKKLDSPEQHIHDTLKAGDGLCDEAVVRMVVDEGPLRIRELIAWGARFDRAGNGNYDLGREGGHGVNRIIHHKDSTGLETENTLLNRVHNTPEITILPHHFAIDLITEHHLPGYEELPSDLHCYGAYVLNLITNEILKIPARVTVIATGGGGQVYANTTNPVIATGDGIAMAYRAKARISNMEFVQFHPTALYNPGESPSFLISEAVRGFGAILRDRKGERFMKKYDSRMELASRDIVARAIDFELKKSGEPCVFLDCTHLDQDDFSHQFPNIWNKCRSIGLDIAKDWIPVVPAAHYLCGGIQVDKNGRTNIQNLYACGECTSTGLHGANRLASNSLLEALVYAHRASLQAVNAQSAVKLPDNIPEWDATGVSQTEEYILIAHNRRELQQMMTDLVGIVRSNQRLKVARQRLDLLYRETRELYLRNILSQGLIELMNLVSVAHLIVEQSIARKENRGAFFNKDFVRAS